MQSKELKIVFDTNVIYQLKGEALLKDEVVQVIQADTGHKDLVISWYLPEAVRNEREHQLRGVALKAFTSLKKLERMLDFEFGIQEEEVLDRLRARIDSQIALLDLEILPVDPSKVDWAKMMSDAAFRQAPFSPGENEKGFRDAVIVEAVCQLVEASTDSRIVVVTADELMTEAILQKTSQKVEVVTSI